MAIAATAPEGTSTQEKVQVTVEDLFVIQDDRRYELFDGEVYMVPPPAATHQWLSTMLHRLLSNHAVEQDAGIVFAAPFAVILSPLDYVEPDLVFVSKDRLDLLSDRGVEGAPDLVVEILSDSDGSRRRDIKVKFELYERAGIAHYWIVDPRAKTLAEYQLRGGKYEKISSHGGDGTFKPTCFPNLAISLPEIWPPPLRR